MREADVEAGSHRAPRRPSSVSRARRSGVCDCRNRGNEASRRAGRSAADFIHSDCDARRLGLAPSGIGPMITVGVSLAASTDTLAGRQMSD